MTDAPAIRFARLRDRLLDIAEEADRRAGIASADLAAALVPHPGDAPTGAAALKRKQAREARHRQAEHQASVARFATAAAAAEQARASAHQAETAAAGIAPSDPENATD